ncbi:MAG: VCBS repeat-containing protein [Rhodothermia bacterium]|nr:VCBS repeat-containing protein [Rhodothermia bacterium]
MRSFAILIVASLLGTTFSSTAQTTDLVWDVPPASSPSDPYSEELIGGQFGGSFSVTGPFDLDNDGKTDILVSDFSGGQRIHVFEVQGPDTWELVYSTPFFEDELTPRDFIVSARHSTGADLDGDGMQEIVFVSGDEFVGPSPSGSTSGIFIYEFTGTDNDYGSQPAAAFGVDQFGAPTPNYVKADNFSAIDIDGDGKQELLWPNDSSFPLDEWYILSVNGDIGSGFETLIFELRLSSGNSGDANYDPVDRGGGSTYAINAADLDGDGSYEISFHSWNDFNFHNGDVLGPDSYLVPSATDPDIFLKATSALGVDDLSWFNGVVVDINGDGDDEIFYPRERGYQAGDYEYVSVMNYEIGEDPLRITAEQLKLDIVGPLTSYGIDAGDINGDGTIELIGAGRGYDGEDYTAGRKPKYLRIAEWKGGVGGDPENPANYSLTEVEFEITPFDTLFNFVVRDSAGVVESFYENAGEFGEFPTDRAEEISPTSIAYLGDADGDGVSEVAVGFYGINDSLDIIDETYDASAGFFRRTTRERTAAPHRPVFRIFEIDDQFGVHSEARLVLPSDYKLSENYPNPFNPSTTFDVTLPLDKTVSVLIYDVTGRLVRTLAQDVRLPAGTHTFVWDGRVDGGAVAASGVYFYALEYGNFRQSRKMTMVK